MPAAGVRAATLGNSGIKSAVRSSTAPSKLVGLSSVSATAQDLINKKPAGAVGSVTFSGSTVDKPKGEAAKKVVEEQEDDEEDNLMYEDEGVGGLMDDNDFEYDDEYY